MITQTTYFDYLNCLLSGEKNKCIELMRTLVNQNYSEKEIFNSLIKPSLYYIGRQWERGLISIAEEHRASFLTEQLLDYISITKSNKAISTCDKEPKKKALLSCIEKEFHTIGLKIVNMIFESRGWETVVLGANVPVNEIVNTAKELKPELVVLSFNYLGNIHRLIHTLNRLIEYDNQKKILVGGFAITENYTKLSKDFPNVVFIRDLEELDLYISNFLTPA